MTKNRIKKIIKIALILSAKQVWGWGCSVYLMTYQPYLTIKNLIEKKDTGQMLMLGLTALTPTLAYLAARGIWDKWRYGVVLDSIGPVGIGAGAIQTLIATYLAYWLYRATRE
mgnify:CR=1 FL=1